MVSNSLAPSKFLIDDNLYKEALYYFWPTVTSHSTITSTSQAANRESSEVHHLSFGLNGTPTSTSPHTKDQLSLSRYLNVCSSTLNSDISFVFHTLYYSTSHVNNSDKNLSASLLESSLTSSISMVIQSDHISQHQTSINDYYYYLLNDPHLPASIPNADTMDSSTSAHTRVPVHRESPAHHHCLKPSSDSLVLQSLSSSLQSFSPSDLQVSDLSPTPFMCDQSEVSTASRTMSTQGRQSAITYPQAVPIFSNYTLSAWAITSKCAQDPQYPATRERKRTNLRQLQKT